MYGNTGNDVNIILNMVYNLANSHVYASINKNGRESLCQLERIINFIENGGINLPDVKKVQIYLFSERNGWGSPFDGTSLSKIVKE